VASDMKLKEITELIKFGQDFEIKSQNGESIFKGTLMEYFEEDSLYKSICDCDVADFRVLGDLIILTIERGKGNGQTRTNET
jgi:hypothetical protein